MVFLGLMAMSVVRWIVGAFELLQEQHLVRVTREHLQRALACKLGNSLIRLPLLLLIFFYFFFPFLLSLTESQRTLVAV